MFVVVRKVVEKIVVGGLKREQCKFKTLFRVSSLVGSDPFHFMPAYPV